MRLLAIAAFLMLNSTTLANSQSAIETMIFITTGHEIEAPLNKFKGEIKLSDTYSESIEIETSGGCAYNIYYTKFKSRQFVDFSKVLEVNLKANENIGFISYNSSLSGTASMLCSENRMGNKNCMDYGYIDLHPKQTDGKLTDKVVIDAANKMLTRKTAAYKYFRENFCKARAF